MHSCLFAYKRYKNFSINKQNFYISQYTQSIKVDKKLFKRRNVISSFGYKTDDCALSYLAKHLQKI